MRFSRRALLLSLSCLLLCGLIFGGLWHFQLGPFQPRWIDAGGIPVLAPREGYELIAEHDPQRGVVIFKPRDWYGLAAPEWRVLAGRPYLLAKKIGPDMFRDPEVYGCNALPEILLNSPPTGAWLEQHLPRSSGFAHIPDTIKDKWGG